MESLSISLKETFRKGIPNSKLQCVCQISDAEYLICTKNEVFHFSVFKDSGNNLVKLNCSFKACIFIKELNIICAIGSSLPNIEFFSIRSGFPLISEAYRLSSSLYDSIQYSPTNKKLIVSGDSVEIFDLVIEWKLFQIDPMISLVNKLSFSCEKMTSNVFLDEMRQILIIPTLFGISTVDLANLNRSPSYNLAHSVNNYQFGDIPFQTMSFYNSQKVSKKRSVGNVPYKYLLTTNSNGDLSLWNSSSIKNCRPIQNYPKLNEVSILCEFIDSEFCLIVTESKPNYFVILFDVKTGKNVKLASFDNKVVRMNVISKKSVSILTEDFFVLYQINIPWHLFSKTASNAVTIRRYPVFTSHVTPSSKAARLATLCNDGIISLFSPDVHFILTELGTTCSNKIVDFIYDRSSSLRVRDKIFSMANSDTFGLNSNLAAPNVSEKSSGCQEKEAKVVKFQSSLMQMKRKQQAQKSLEGGERFLLLLDDGSIQIFKSQDDNFLFDRTIEGAKLVSLSFTYIKSEGGLTYDPVFVGFNRSGDLITFKFDSFEVLTRTAVTTNNSKGRKRPLFSLVHHQTNSIIAIYDSEIVTIDALTKTVMQTESLNSRPSFASLEDNLLLIAFENRTIQLRHFDSSNQQRVESIKLLECVTFATVQYETFIIVTNDKTVRVGQSFDNCAIFEFPFKIFAAGFLNPELDLVLGLDFEMMVINRNSWFPFIDKPFECGFDTGDPKSEVIFTNIQEKAVLYNIEFENENKNEAFKLKESHSSRGNPKINISKYKSSPQIIKIQPNKNNMRKSMVPSLLAQENGDDDDVFSLLNQKKKLPELKSKEEMMNNKSFLELFKDVGASLNEGAEKIKSFAKLDTIQSVENHNQPSSSETGQKESQSEAQIVPVGEDESNAANPGKKKIKKKKRVLKKSADVNEAADEAAMKNDENAEVNSMPADGLNDDSNSPTDRIFSPLNPPANSCPSPNPRSKSIIKKLENAAATEIANKSCNGNESPISAADKSEAEISIDENSNQAGDRIENEDENGDDKSDAKVDNNENEGKSSADKSNEENGNCESDNKSDIAKSNNYTNIQKTDSNRNQLQKIEPKSTSDSTDEAFSEIDKKQSQNEDQSGIETFEHESSTNSSTNEKFSSTTSSANQLFQNSPKPQKAENPGKYSNETFKSEQSQKAATMKNRQSNNKKFVSLKQHNPLTMSSPDLVLLQAQLGKVRIKVDESRIKASCNADEFFQSNRRNLPLITVHLIQKTITRTKSEYSLVKLIDQPAFYPKIVQNGFVEKVGPLQLQIQKLNCIRNYKDDAASQCNKFVYDGKQKRDWLTLKPLLPSSEQTPRKKYQRSKRMEFSLAKRTDPQPLGNIELAINIVSHDTNKK